MRTTITDTPMPATITAGDIAIEFSPACDVRAIRAHSLLVNQFLPGPHDTMTAGIYLRRHVADEPGAAPQVQRIVGSTSAVTTFSVGADRAIWSGSSLGVEHTVELVVDATGWVWRVTLTGDSRDEYDVVFAQDLALSPPGAALSSEPYVCQYIAHRMLGDAIASRQTMTAGPQLPLLVTGIAEGVAGYATDAMQTHTPAARRDGLPHGLADLTDGIYQYELATPTLVSNRLRVDNGPVQVHGYAVLDADYRGELPALEAQLPAWADRARSIAARPGTTTPVPVATSAFRSAALLSGRDLDDAELVEVTGAAGVRLAEKDADGRLLSFFTPEHAHVVRGAKELLVERSHGHVLKAGDDVAPNDDIVSTTAYAGGVFASHVVLGNTSANRVVTVQRHALGLIRSSGVRVLVAEPGGTWHLLANPSAITLDLGSVHWVYLSDLGRIDVRTVAAAHTNRIDILVEADRELDILATIDVEHGDEPLWRLDQGDEHTVTLTAADGSDVAGRYPQLTYVFGSSAPITDDAVLGGSVADGSASGGALSGGAASGMLTTRTRGNRLELTITGSLDAPQRAAELLADRRRDGLDIAAERDGHRETVRAFTGGLAFGAVPDGGATGQPASAGAIPAAELSTLLPWYVHDALIHFLVPHGLEQYSGAAWGTRDVCQGPFELLLAFGRFEVARQILVTTFGHQQPTGEFPQWFMFDAYEDRYSDDCHGDVPVWPLFALGEYLTASGDLSILDAQIPFWDPANRRAGTVGATIAAHVEQLLDYLDAHRLPGTSLPAYGEGDWDDTLQPADPAMRTTMASTWTSALLVQATRVTAAALGGTGGKGSDGNSINDHAGGRWAGLANRLQVMSDAVAADIREHMLVDGVLSGYVDRRDGVDHVVIHPSDDRTGIAYRLIPMTRSVIAEVLDMGEAADHVATIHENLHFPDGVRLMNRPAAFDDGIPHVFLRGEQAANVGREVGLMYTHAHIRWVEALATLGSADTLNELVRVSPLGTNDRLPHAHKRQRNVYYSSSDAAFADRYAFAEGFDRLRTGDVGVKGGWRVYSSGPGIYLRQLIQGVLGLTLRSNSLVVDPVLPLDADGLVVEFEVGGILRQIRYRVGADVESVAVRAGAAWDELKPVAGLALSNRYRAAGVEVPFTAFDSAALLEVSVPEHG